MPEFLEDAFAAAGLFVCTLAVLFNSWKASAALFPDDDSRLLAIHCGVLAWSYVAVASFLASVLGMLGAIQLYAFAVSLSCVGLYVTRWRVSRQTTVARGKHGGIFPRDQDLSLSDRDSVIIAGVWAFVAMAMVVDLAVNAVFAFPTDFDTLMYHRPLVDQWIQSSSLYAPNDAVWYNPSSNELLALWLAIPFSGDFWLGLANIPSWLLLVLAAFELAKILGIHCLVAHLVVLAMVCSPLALRQIESGKNDIACCALFVAGLLYVVRFVQTNRNADLVYLGLAAGLVAGVKYYAVGYAAVLCALAFSAAFVRRGVKVGIRTMPLALLLSAATGGYWYLRNASIAGSPMHPLGSRPEAPTDARLVRSVWDSSIIGHGDLSVLQEYPVAVLLQGGVFLMGAIIVLPVVFTWFLLSIVARAIVRDVPRHRLQGHLVVAGSVVACWLVFGFTPYVVEEFSQGRLAYPYLVVRFSQVPIALTAMTAGLFLTSILSLDARCRDEASSLRVAVRLIPIWFLIATTLGGWILTLSTSSVEHRGIGVYLILSLVLLSLLIFKKARGHVFAILRPFARTKAYYIAAISFFVFVLATPLQANWWHRGFLSFYQSFFDTQVFTVYESISGPHRIVAIDQRYYPLLGSRRQYEVIRPPRLLYRTAILDVVIERQATHIADVNSLGEVPIGYASAVAFVRRNPEVFREIEGSRSGLFRVDVTELERLKNLGK